LAYKEEEKPTRTTRKEENRKRRKRGAGAFSNDVVEEAAESLNFLFPSAINFDHGARRTTPSGLVVRR
jgi:hypothetical protein